MHLEATRPEFRVCSKPTPTELYGKVPKLVLISSGSGHGKDISHTNNHLQNKSDFGCLGEKNPTSPSLTE